MRKHVKDRKAPTRTKRAQQQRRYYGSDIPQAFKLREAANLLSISRPTLRRLIERGLIRPMRVVRHILISDEELRRFMREGVSE